ncbi:MAG: hypothetical protein ACJ735_06710 [Actinomycetes bacterium]
MPRLRNLAIRVRGGEPLPEGVQLDLVRSERVLTWGRVAGGGIAAATDFGLRIRPGDGGEPATHLWHEINRATWTDGDLTVEDMSGAAASYRLSEPRGVPVAVREHVNATVVISDHHSLGDVGVRVVARRDLRTGQLVWSTVFDRPADADNASLNAAADQLLTAVRRRFGA